MASETLPDEKAESTTSFAEEALRLGGKGDDEVRRMGAVDRADEQVEKLFDAKYRTEAGPIHRAVWDGVFVRDLWAVQVPPIPSDVKEVMDRSLAVVRRHRDGNTLSNEHGKISEQVLADLGEAGYWGLLVDRKFGGSGASFAHFGPFLTKMATIDPTTAGMASVHGCIGAVDPVQGFGTPDQKAKWLPQLASGKRLSAFALTEPGAGSDLTALKTVAVRDGDDYVVTGEKLFITNAVPGRTIGLVCLIENKPAVLIVDLPDTETEQFRLKTYGLYALKTCYNNGLIFNGLRVPATNRLDPPKGDGLTVAYHGLNRGRVALCSNAAGTMRAMLADMIPWAQFRVTYGEPIAKRELVQRRIAHLAGLIVGCDALVEWCSALLDGGHRGEMECIIAKIFGSEAQKEAAIELHMKTHGGRAFLKGHLFGDNVHEFLAPCIYEGEGEMLGMAFFKSLVKAHGRQFFEPIGKTLAAAKIKKPQMWNPLHLWKLKGPLWQYSKWAAGQKLKLGGSPDLPPMPKELKAHAAFAIQQMRKSAMRISGIMRKHQLKLADRQCRMSDISSQVQALVVILCTSLYAARREDEIVRKAADALCRSLRRKVTREPMSDRDFRFMTELGAAIAAGKGTLTEGIEAPPILMPYQQ